MDDFTRIENWGIEGASSVGADVKVFVAGWSSLVARRAHNPKVVGSNPAPATKFYALRGVAREAPVYRGFLLLALLKTTQGR